MAAAKAWGMLPSAFDSLHEVDRARILAHERLASLYESHVSHVQRKVSEEDSGKPAPRPNDGGGFFLP